MRGLVQMLGWVAAYAVAAYAGRLSAVGDQDFALVWPAGGVALVWFLLRDKPLLSVDLPVLLATNAVVSLATGVEFDVAGSVLVATLAQQAVGLWLVRRWTPDLWGCGGDRSLSRTIDLGRLTMALVVAATVGMSLGVLFTLALGETTGVAELFVWFGRLVCGTIFVTTLTLLMGHWFSHGRRFNPFWRSRLLEAVVLVLLTTAAVVVVLDQDLPIVFTLLLMTAWAALRFSTLFTAWHSVGVATAVVAATMLEVGPFSSVENPYSAALVAQAFVTLLLLLGLAIAVGHEERTELAAQALLAHREQARQAHLLTAIVDAMGDGVTVLEEPHRVTLRNPAAISLFGMDLDGLDEVAPRILNADGTPMAPEDSVADRALAGEDLRHVDLLVRRPDGSEVNLRLAATHLPPTTPGEPSRAVLVFHDVTRDVAQAKELGHFARVVAHDLSNALAAFSGWAALLQQRAEEDDLPAEYVERIATRMSAATDRLGGMVEGLLQRATSQDRALARERVDLDEVIRRIVETREVGQHVTWSPGLPPVEGDPVLIEQSLDNLVGNAVKYVDPAETPRVTVSAEVAEPGWVRVAIADNGLGIPDGDHDKVFDEFHRAHGSAFSGTGLGLSIVRAAVVRHGGTVAARPNPAGQGTIFELTLPAAAQRAGRPSGQSFSVPESESLSGSSASSSVAGP